MSRNFSAAQIRLNVVDLINDTVDPTAGGGVAAAIGSFYTRGPAVGTAAAYLKTGAAATAWEKLLQSFDWYSVLDYGAVGDSVTDDTSSVQAAINARAAAGGGMVYFPPGSYAITQITVPDNIQLAGAGASSILLWTWDAATAAGSMITLTGADHVKINYLSFDGSGLTNPDAGRDNHLLKIDVGSTELQVMHCAFGGMVAGSGDGVHVVGTAGNTVSRIWVVENTFDGCSRYGIGFTEGIEFGWILDNYLTNCETEIAIVADNNIAVNAILVQGNEVVHTSLVPHALRFEGPALLITRLVLAENIVIGGFWTMTNIQYATVDGQVVTSGAHASSDPVLRVYGFVSHAVFLGNLLDRAPATGVGPCMTLERSGGASPIYCRVGQNLMMQETLGASFITFVDITACSVGGNLMRVVDAGASTMFGIDVQAVTVAATNLLIGPGNQMTAGAGSMRAGVRLLNNGANVTDVSIVGNQGTQLDYGAHFEGVASANFNGQLLYGGNNFNSTVGDYVEVGVTVQPRIGFNAGTFGAQLFTGTGSPEGVVTARISSMYLRRDGGQSTCVYYKESGTGNTGWVAIGGGIMPFGTGDTTVVATAVYMAPGWIATSIATEIQQAVTRPGTIRNLRVHVATAGVLAATNTYTVRKNGVDTTLLTTIGNATAGDASDLVNSFTVVAGDLVALSVTKSGVVATGQANVTASIELI